MYHRLCVKVRFLFIPKSMIVYITLMCFLSVSHSKPTSTDIRPGMNKPCHVQGDCHV